MAERAFPAAKAPRTVTVRVRSLAVAAAVAAILAAVWWSISSATGLQPLSVPAGSYAPRGLAELPHTADPADTGPPVYRWAGGGRYVVTLYLHNAASDGRYTAFHPIRIPADGIRGMTFVFHANPKACGNDDPRSVSSQDAVNVHFTALGVIHDTQVVPLSEAVEMTGPPTGAC